MMSMSHAVHHSEWNFTSYEEYIFFNSSGVGYLCMREGEAFARISPRFSCYVVSTLLTKFSNFMIEIK